MHFIFGLAGSKPRLDTLEALADTIPTPRALADQDRVRGFAELRHQAQSWAGERRVCAPGGNPGGLDIRFVVARFTTGSAE